MLTDPFAHSVHLINAGNLLRNHGRSDEALAVYREAAERDPGNVDAHHLVGSALGRHGLREESRAHYLEALRLDPANDVVHSSLLYLAGYDPDLDPAVLRNEHEMYTASGLPARADLLTGRGGASHLGR